MSIVNDEEGMIYRLQEYHGILRKKYGLPVKQFVIYLGQKASRMQTRLSPEEVFQGFGLKSLREYAHHSLLSSPIPEEIILAILSDFGDRKPAEVLRGILSKLRAISPEEITLRKYIRQLSVLARLRNLTQETQKQIQDMGLTYNVTEDFLYQQGIEKGIEQGIEQGIERGIEQGIEQGIERGIEKGIEKGKKAMIVRMLNDKTLTVEKIAELAEVAVGYVRQVAKALKK